MAKYHKKQSIAENGMTDDPTNVYGELINNASFWIREEATTDAEIDARAVEFRNLCASRSELPIVENFCLFLGTTLDTVRNWIKSDNVSQKRKAVLGAVITWAAAIWTQAWHKGIVRDVTYIWYSKQWYGMREPDTTINLGGANPLKELPSAASVAQAYLVEVEETNVGEENNAES